jgi:outer membrane protein assembly factor BamB
MPTTPFWKSRRVGAGLLAGLVALLGASPLLAADPDNSWTYWRGAGYDGHSATEGLPESWDPEGGEGSNLLWKREDLGGRSTPVVMNGRLYFLTRDQPGTPREGEKVVCLDVETGETLWENRFNVWLSDVPDTRVGWSSVVADPETGNVYALGVCAYFMCIDGESGETIWSHPLHEQYGMLSTYGGRTNFPIVHEDLVIISGIIINWGERAKPNHRLIAFDKRTGVPVWFEGTQDLPEDTTYSAPSLTTIDGQRQLIMGCGDGGVWGKQPRTGRTLWNYKLSRRGLFATPLVVGNRVYAGHSEENIDGVSMGAVVGLEISGTGEQTECKELWKIEELVAGRSSPVLIDGRLYVVDDRCKLWIIDAETGEFVSDRRITIGDRKQWASLVYADGKLYCLTENGRWAIMRPTEDGVEFLDKGRMRDQAFLASPAVAEGKLFFLGTNGLYCVGSGAGQAPQSVPQLADETPVEEHQEVAWLQIVPAEAVIEPGETIDYTVRKFNALGQSLGTAEPGEVQFAVDGPGQVENGEFVAADSSAHEANVITAKLGQASGEARVRVIPALPWKFTFDELSNPPVTWVGARYRHVIRTIDGSPAMVKVNTIPKGTRSQGWMGPSDLSDYTVTADVKGTRMADQLPDIGLIAQGYTLDLMGNSQKLQIRTWTPQLRMSREVDFPWQEDIWYRMKFQASVEEDPAAPEGKVAVLRGKVWPKDSAEPKEWTVEARDTSPQTSGSPGLFGNAKVAELHLDNIEVVPNP